MPKPIRRIKPGPVLMAGLLALVTLGWTDTQPGTSKAEPELAALVPGEICPQPENCQIGLGDHQSHWISQTGNGQLYLVVQTDCARTNRCNAWFVERSARGLAARLNIEGQFKVLNSGTAIPDVQTRRSLSDNEMEYTRYSWKAGTFVRVETRNVFLVDGEECGSALECYQKAALAHKNRNTDKALKIWEQVHKLSWI